MEDCSKTSAGAVAGLPDDLLVEILSRVPAKSICRFRCVSKAWRDLIADPNHRKKLCQAMQGLFFVVVSDPYSNYDYIDVTEGSVPLDVVDDPSFDFLTERPGMGNLVLEDSCNGLILFGHQPPHDRLGGNIVCNPTTKQWGYVPACGSPDRIKNTFLAFDPAVSSQQFHLVQFQTSKEGERLEALHAYSSETGTWNQNQIDSQEGLLAGWHHHVRLSYNEDPRRAFLKGFLYLIVWDRDQFLSQILVVDVQGKARKMITVPGAADVEHFLSCNIELSQGRLHCMTRKILEVNYELELWVLQDYDTQEWVLKNTVSSQDVCGELTGSNFDLSVVDIHQDCNIVYLFKYGSSLSHLIAYNMDNKELSAIATFRYQEGPLAFAHYVPCFLESPALTS